jgi:thymidylate synthase/tetrahydromethanopterin S-methyltransferase subunit A
MNLTIIGSDPFLNRPIKKLIFDSPPKLQLFNESDVIIGHPSSNLAIAVIYTWKTDSPPETFRKIVEKLSNYAYLTGYWRTTNGARYVFSNILADPNVNKLFVLIFDASDNGHLLANALSNFWQNGTDENNIIINSKAQNPKFEQLSSQALSRIREQCDLIIVPNITEKDFPELDFLIKKSIDEPDNGANLDNSKSLKPIFISQVIKNHIIYDDGARFPEPFDVDLTQTAKKVTYTKKTIDSTIGQSIQAEDLDDALDQIAAFVFEHGSSFEDERKIINIECRSLSITIRDPLRKIPEGFSEGYIKDYVSEFMAGPKPDARLDYNYHDRIFKRWGNQVERVILLLSDSEKSLSTRRAAISLWDPATDLENPTAPCLTLIWTVIRENRLEFHVLFRSHHLATVTTEGKLMPGEGAFVPNIYAIATLQDHISKRLNMTRGPLVLTDFSGHLYMSKVK